jgi:hypothetical protein
LNANLRRIHELLGYTLLSQGYAAESIPHFQAANVQDGLGIAQLEVGDLPDRFKPRQSSRRNDTYVKHAASLSGSLLGFIRARLCSISKISDSRPRKHGLNTA